MSSDYFEISIISVRDEYFNIFSIGKSENLIWNV